MKRKTLSCCRKPGDSGNLATEFPEQIQKELDAMGGLDALANRIPPQMDLEERGGIYQALSDPLRLSILYIIKDQPLCVCVINRFMRLSGSKLSYHLNILKESGLILGEYDGNWIIYSVTERGRRLLQCTEYAGRKP
jgi:ArsR family transcriptional regulator, arsenate/arsenite/antimonite-responsive transcriptional repressor